MSVVNYRTAAGNGGVARRGAFQWKREGGSDTAGRQPAVAAERHSEEDVRQVSATRLHAHHHGMP